MFTHTIFGGDKNEWIIAFYGYGHSASVYEPFYELISDTHNLIIIDNPMHDYVKPIYPVDLQSYVQELMVKYSIKKLSTISFSMGSRLNLYMPLFFEKELEKIIVIAPDGIKHNFWNRVAISTPWGRRLFKYFVDHGNVYMRILTFLHKIRIVNKSMYAFSKWNMRDATRRRLVYNGWMNMQFLRPDLKIINSAIEKNEILLVSFFGNDDPVIPLSVYKKCKKVFPTGKHKLVDGDHNILSSGLFKQLQQEIRS